VVIAIIRIELQGGVAFGVAQFVAHKGPMGRLKEKRRYTGWR
jgi:hypothetical protein